MHAHMYTHAHIYIHMCIYIYMYTYAYIHTCMCKHINYMAGGIVGFSRGCIG